MEALGRSPSAPMWRGDRGPCSQRRGWPCGLRWHCEAPHWAEAVGPEGRAPCMASRPQEDLWDRAQKSWRARPGQIVARWAPSHTDEKA
eukprot:6069611-Pyramimonas_sp.AAC.1